MRLFRVFAVIFFVCFFQLANSQTFGVRAGLNYSKFLGPTETGVEETFGYSTGFHFGLSYSYEFTDLFSLRTELVYIQNGSTYDYVGDSYYIIRQSDKTTFEEGQLENYNLNISNAYISIPIVANYRINDKWEIFGGGYVNMLIGPTGRGQMTFESNDRPEDIRFRQSLDFRYNNNNIEEVNGRFVPLNEIGILVDGDIVTLPTFAGAYTRQGEKTGNKFNFLDFGLTAGFHYFLNKGFFVGLTFDYGIPDLTNNDVDISLKELNPDNSFKFSDDKDRHFGIQASFGFRF
ncbi:MAG: outer membrane beta-barrel protein [Saprospiraceae bacterium]|nr:outer membrane beta-barrel protein [Saprospiraceae bacterium]